MGERIGVLLGVVAPFFGLLLAIYLSWGMGIYPIDLGLLITFFLFSGFGVTVGYHRLFAHPSFKAHRAVKYTLGIAGSMAWEGGVFSWTAKHRQHHQYSDTTGDVHSPHIYGASFWGVLRGLWYAHIGWMFSTDPPDHRYIPDLKKDPDIVWLNATWFLWSAVGIVLPGLIGGIATQSWYGAFLGSLWGGLVRVFFAHHVTWSINSICHTFGSQPYRTGDHSKNNVLCGVLGLGEGWHNNHHAFPSSARHGLEWWQFDLSWMVIFVLQKCGLVWDVYTPTARQRENKSLS